MYIHACIFMYVFIYIYLYVYVYIVYIYIHTHTHVHPSSLPPHTSHRGVSIQFTHVYTCTLSDLKRTWRFNLYTCIQLHRQILKGRGDSLYARIYMYLERPRRGVACQRHLHGIIRVYKKSDPSATAQKWSCLCVHGYAFVSVCAFVVVFVCACVYTKCDPSATVQKWSCLCVCGCAFV